LKKNYRIENIEVTNWAADGNAIARDGELVIFVRDAIPGDIVDIDVRRRRNYGEGRIVRMLRQSPLSVAPFCEQFSDCAGCVMQRIPYAEQLRFKEQQVRDQLQRIGGIAAPVVHDIIAAGQTQFYRNKLEFTFSCKRWLTADEIGTEGFDTDSVERRALGYHIAGRYDKILDIRKCWLQPQPSNEIRTAARQYGIDNDLSFFDLRSKTGLLRGIIIRTASTGETMVIMIFGDNDAEQIDAFMTMLNSRFDLASLNFVVNTKLNEMIQDLDIVNWAGKPYIEERMGDLVFRIGPKTFYQTNSVQAHTLYRTVAKYAALTGVETVYDLYTGAGTIACFLASAARRVVGIEFVPEAIDDARVNAAINGIDNAVFYAGDMKDTLNAAFIEQNGKPDVVVIDPPRAGMHPDVPEVLKLASPAKIVYVSCNPATQARDLALLRPEYQLVECQPVDMFPHTPHVENVALLTKTGGTDS
jgi:23S rRNA (uracil1939-C5)-methyltransferase